MLNQSDIINNDEDAKFVRELTHATTNAVKDIERFIMRRIEQLNQNTKLVSFATESQISKIDMSKGQIEINSTKAAVNSKKESKTYQFDYLIGADGAKHHAVMIY